MLRLGVAGCGAVFERNHLPALRGSRDWELVAACDPAPERRTWLQDAMRGRLAVFESLSELLAASTVDAVLISTPPDTHCALTVQALQAGLHVLVEKPMALNPADATAMLETSVRMRRHLWVGFSRRYLRAYVDLKRQLVRVGQDRIRGVRYTFSADAQNWHAVSGYLGDETRGGGVVDDIVSHQLDLLPWLHGFEIREISGESLDTAGDQQGIRCHVRFETGLVAQCEARHIDRYLETVTVEMEDRTLLAHWREGVREVWHRPGPQFFYGRLAALSRSARRVLRRRSSPMVDSFVRQWTTFAGAVQGGRTPLLGATASSGLRNVQALYACRLSLEAGGRWVAVPGKTGSFV